MLATTGAIQGTPHEKIYQELELESLKSRRWYKCLSCMFKIMKEEGLNDNPFGKTPTGRGFSDLFSLMN